MTDTMIHRLVAHIRSKALAHAAAPTSTELATRLGISRSGAIQATQRAVQAGLIVVHRGQNARVIAAADGTWRTAGHPGAPHWRDRTATIERRASP